MKIHIVQKGDTIWDIAKKYGVDFEEVKDLNPQISSPDMIMPGMKIKIPSTTKQVKKETMHPKEKQKQQSVKEQQLPHKPIQMIPEDDQKKPKEVKIEKPMHPMKEMPKVPEYPEMKIPKMPEAPKDHEYSEMKIPKMPEVPKDHEYSEKKQPETKEMQYPKHEMKEQLEMPTYPKLEQPLGTPKMPEYPKMKTPEVEEKHQKKQVEHMPQYSWPMVPCGCYFPYQPCCQQMYHHWFPVGAPSPDQMYSAHHMMHHPQAMEKSEIGMPGHQYMGKVQDEGYHKGFTYPQHEWETQVPSYKDVKHQQNKSTPYKMQEWDKSTHEIEQFPSHVHETIEHHHSYPTPPMYPNFRNPNDNNDGSDKNE